MSDQRRHQRARRILVVGPAWIGDMVMAAALFRLLRGEDRDVSIDVLGPPWSVPLAGRMADVRRGIALSVDHGEFAFGRRRRLGIELRAEGYDRAIVLPRAFKAALVPYFARIPWRTGYATELRSLLLTDARVLDRVALNQTVKRFMALGVSPGEPVPEPQPPRLRIDTANRAALLDRFGIGRRPAVALMPGAAFGPAKRWPVENFASLARDLVARGFEVWVLGSAIERELGNSVCDGAGPAAHNLCGATTLEDTVDLLSAAQAAVTNDSGLMHVAAAAGTHVVALFGSSSPVFTPPLTPNRTVHYLGIECSPCFARECPLGHLRCLTGIAPGQVLSALPGPAASPPAGALDAGRS
jgi:heptosyltransferase-2